MKIASLHLSNFRGHRETTIPLAGLTVITGPNGSGKSSIRDGLEWLLSGRCSCTNERGQGPIIHAAAQACSVTATLPDGGAITRTNPGRLFCSWAPNHKKPELAMAPMVGCDGDRARLALSSGRYFALSPADRKALLYDLLDLHILPTQVQTELELLDDHDAPRVAKSTVGMAGFGNLDHAYKAVYSARTEANRQVKDLTALLAAKDQEHQAGVFLSDDEAEALVAKSQELMARERELLAVGRQWSSDPLVNPIFAELERLKPTEGAFCKNCNFPTPAEETRAARQAELDKRVAYIREVGAGQLERTLTELEQVRQELEDTRDRLAAGRQLRESMSSMAAARRRLEEQTRLQGTLQTLVDFFGGGPGSLMHRMIRPRIAQFEERINTVLGCWGMSVAYTSGLTVEAMRPGQEPVPYEGLSDGEQVLVALAHQVAIAWKTGLNIVCVDRIEALDYDAQANLAQACLEIVSTEGGLDHILLMGVRVDLEAFAHPGVAMVDMENLGLVALEVA